MEIKLKTQDNPYSYDIDKFLLYNRGIKEVDRYINANKSELIDASKLPNIQRAKDMFLKHIEGNSKIGILVDSDFDGYASASTMYRYLKKYKNKVVYFIHETKAHGLENNDEIVQQIIDSQLEFLIIPDAGTNDYSQCLKLNDLGIDVLILDHHEFEEGGNIIKKELTNTIIVNPKDSDNKEYENKALSGCGVVYKFICYLEDTDELLDYLDITGLSFISDRVSLKTYENHYIVKETLKNITHPFMQAIIAKQQFSLGYKTKDFTPRDMGFGLIPLINACTRIGSLEEKDLMFKAFAEIYGEYDYKWRKVEKIENVYERAARVCSNIKARQGKIKKTDSEYIINKIKEENLFVNSIIIVNGDNNINTNLTGYTAMTICNYFKKPVLLGNEQDGILKGSGRSTDDIENMKDILEETKEFEFSAGHQGAFGYNIKKENINNAIEKINIALSERDMSIMVDDILSDEDIDNSIVYKLCEFENYSGCDIEEITLCVENIEFDSSNLKIKGENKNTIEFTNINGVKFIQFNCDENNQLLSLVNSLSDGYKLQCELKVVAKPSLNNFDSMITPQMKIEDIEVEESSISITETINLGGLSSEELYNDFDDLDEDW